MSHAEHTYFTWLKGQHPVKSRQKTFFHVWHINHANHPNHSAEAKKNCYSIHINPHTCYLVDKKIPGNICLDILISCVKLPNDVLNLISAII